MMTVREAMQRCAVNNVQINRGRIGTGEWEVTLPEWTATQIRERRYVTTDLEDAVLAGSAMRRRRAA